MSNIVIEMPIYDGSLKKWRVLNLNSGTFYGKEHNTELQAWQSITKEHREDVRKIAIRQLQDLLKLHPDYLTSVEELKLPASPFGSSFATWEEMKDGYGIGEVPKELAANLVCIMCGRKTRCKLYTDQAEPDRVSSTKLYQMKLQEFSKRIWCKDHAIEWFKD